MTDGTIQISADDLAFVQDVLDSGVDYYRAYDRMLPYLNAGSDQYFWFEQASIINQQAIGIQPPSNNNLSSTYIIAHSKYGLLLDGYPVDLAKTSNEIAIAVLRDIIVSNGIIPLESMLERDISAALDIGNQTIGGWGGSFYYWNLPFGGSTVGQAILDSGQDYEKFILSSAAATMAVVIQEYGESPSMSEILAVMSTSLYAQAPDDVKLEIASVVFEAATYGQFVTDAASFGKWTYDPVGDEFYYIVAEGEPGAGERVIATGDEERFLEERQEARGAVDLQNLDYVVEVFSRLGMVEAIPTNLQCFLAGTPIDMWDGTQKPIEEVEADDWVTSYDSAGVLVAGRVARTFHNRAKYILDVHGLMVTPGHVTLCGDGEYKDRHVPMIDILRSDGALVSKDETLIRASTGCVVNSEEDRFVWAIIGDRMDDGTVKIRDKKRVRVGTRHIMSDGRDVSVLDLVSAAGCTVSGDGWVVDENSGAKLPFLWPFTEKLPNPEDYVLQRSQLHLHEIYQADEWEAVRPQMPMPEYGEAGPVISRDPEVVNASPPNLPRSLQLSGYTPAMNRKQRRSHDARRRRASKQISGVQ